MIKVKPIGVTIFIQLPEGINFDNYGEIVDTMCEELGLGYWDEYIDCNDLILTLTNCDEDSPGKIAFDCEQFLRKHLLKED